MLVALSSFLDIRRQDNEKTCIRNGNSGRDTLGKHGKFGFLSTVLAFCLYTSGLKNLDNGKASILASVEPVAATLIGVILYKETVSAGEIFGIILVMVAIVMCNLTNKDKK